MSDLNLDDSNPMAALLANAPKEPTILDKIYQEKQLGQNNQSKEEEKEKGGKGISKQPSLTSVQGTVVVKGDGDGSKKNPVQEADPVVVFDGHSDNESDNEPIGLGVRQPSFVSLHGQIIPKGADSLADLHPVIEEVPLETPEEVPEDDEDEDEDDPQVKIVKRLQAKNANRWAEIGYEPPQDLIPLVRAKSQAQMQGQGLTRNGYLSTSLTKFYMNTDDNKGGKNNNKALPTLNETITEAADETKNATPTKNASQQGSNLYGIPGLSSQQDVKASVPTPTRRKRSGSFGMKLGEASASMERMHLIIPEEEEKKQEMAIPEEVPEEKEEENQEQEHEEEPQQEEEEEEAQVKQKPKPKRKQIRVAKSRQTKQKVIRKIVQRYVDPQDEDEEEEENIEDDEDDYSVEPLYGHLGEIVTEGPDSPVYQTLLSGENPPSIAIPVVKVALRKYLRICNENEWEQEASFISNLIEELPQTMPRKSLQEPRRQRNSLAAGATIERRPRTQSVKATRKHIDYSDNASVSSTSSNYNNRLQRALAKLDAEYEQEAQTLDEYWHSDAVAATYSRTSTEVHELRSRIKSLKRQGKNAEAGRLQRKLTNLETRERYDN